MSEVEIRLGPRLAESGLLPLTRLSCFLQRQIRMEGWGRALAERRTIQARGLVWTIHGSSRGHETFPYGKCGSCGRYRSSLLHGTMISLSFR